MHLIEIVIRSSNWLLLERWRFELSSRLNHELINSYNAAEKWDTEYKDSHPEILDIEFHNFGNASFIMDAISFIMTVIRSDQCGRDKTFHVNCVY